MHFINEDKFSWTHNFDIFSAEIGATGIFKISILKVIFGKIMHKSTKGIFSLQRKAFFGRLLFIVYCKFMFLFEKDQFCRKIL